MVLRRGKELRTTLPIKRASRVGPYEEGTARGPETSWEENGGRREDENSPLSRSND